MCFVSKCTLARKEYTGILWTKIKMCQLCTKKTGLWNPFIQIKLFDDISKSSDWSFKTMVLFYRILNIQRINLKTKTKKKRVHVNLLDFNRLIRFMFARTIHWGLISVCPFGFYSTSFLNTHNLDNASCDSSMLRAQEITLA